MQNQWPCRPPAVHRNRDLCQHILLLCPGFAKKACEVPEAVAAAVQKQEVVQNPLWETEHYTSDAYAPGLSGNAGIHTGIHKQAGGGCVPEYSACSAAALSGGLSGVAKFYQVTVRTDMNKSIDRLDRLMAIIQDTY